jgi:hypothetical protein
MKLTSSAKGGYSFKHQAMLPSLITTEGSTQMKIYSLKRFFILLIFRLLQIYIQMKMKSKAVLNLTSSKINGEISSDSQLLDKARFFSDNNFAQEQIDFVAILMDEAKENDFIVKIGGVK